MMTLFSKRIFFQTVLIGVLYLILVIYFMNISLVKDTLIGSYPVTYKIKLLFALLEGMWTAINRIELAVLIGIAFLTGANLSLLWQKIRSFGNLKKVHVVGGGGSLLGIAGSGCAACGLPIISLLGLSGSIAYLPFHGQELLYISFLLLSVSLISLIRSNKKEQECFVAENVPKISAAAFKKIPV